MNAPELPFGVRVSTPDRALCVQWQPIGGQGARGRDDPMVGGW
jgi:hypothetical protein